MKILSGDEAEAVARGYLQHQYAMSLAAPMSTFCAVLLRHVAAVRCPAPHWVLKRAVEDALEVVSDVQSGSRESLVEDIFDELIALGELQVSEGVVTLPPLTFCFGETTHVYLQGGLPDTPNVLPAELLRRLNYQGAARFLVVDDQKEVAHLRSILVQRGYSEIPQSEWLHRPSEVAWSELLARATRELLAAGPSGHLEGLELLDPSTSTRYYKGRWRRPNKDHNGQFVGKRKARHGNALWYYVAVEDGDPVRALNLPSLDTRFQARDEATWLQCAIDRARDRPQTFVVAREGALVRFGFNAPLPSWAERYILLLGDKVGSESPEKVRGSLFTVEAPLSIEDRVRAFLRQALWLDAVDESGNSI